ncbi:sugar ABC transporter permease [Clostridia bacterium]|nr:sugar ABC transporter permease [Clostridia bacterium]
MTKKKNIWETLWRQRALIIMSVPLLLYKILFSYVPLTGWTMAFQDYNIRIRHWWEQTWIGLDQFKALFTGLQGEKFIRDVINTLGQSVLTLVLGFVFTIILALMLNEVRHIGFKRVIQNITYMPHFLSWIVVAGLTSTVLALPASGGIINQILMNLYIIKEPILFLQEPKYFWGIVAGSHLWKELGWNTIIYLAAMTGIDPTLYEAAEIDGANRYRKMWNITLPSIKSTIVILLIMNIGYVLEAGFEIQYFLGNGIVVEKAETIDIFVLNYGIKMGNYSLATAAGIFKTGVSVILIMFANWVAGRLGEEKLI